MDHRTPAVVIAGALLLASCGRPDASGLYLSRSDRQAALFQLVQTKDGAVTGRLEVISIGPGGTITDQSGSLDGSASKHALVFRPTNPWFGGVSASGSFGGGALTINRNGAQFIARKASLDDFQKAASGIKAKAAEERKRIGDAQAKQAAGAAAATAIEDAADKAGRLQQAATTLRADAARLNEAVAAAPDYGQQSAGNTARMARMVQTAPALSAADRARLSVTANELIVATNQIDVARTQYAIGLDRIIQQAAPLAMAVERFCDLPEARPFSRQCAAATAAATDFESALVHGATVFKSYKLAVQTELSRQNEMARRIGG